MKTSLKKWIRAASKLVVLIPSRSVHEMLLNFMEFVWIWILKDQIEVQEKKNVVVLYSRPLQSVKFGTFTSYWIGANDGKEMYKIACEQALLFGRVKRVSRERASEHAARAKFSVVLLGCQFVTCRGILFAFRKWSLPCLTVYHATVGNQ